MSLTWALVGAGTFLGTQLFARMAQGEPVDDFIRPEGVSVKILFFVPVDETSRDIDEATGGHGYSHVAIDAGEIDKASGDYLIIDCRPTKGVFRRPLSDMGSRRRSIVELSSEVGEQSYGYIRASMDKPFDVLSMAFGGDRTSTYCSKLVWDSLPQSYRTHVLEVCKDKDCGWHAAFNPIPSPNQLALALGVV